MAGAQQITYVGPFRAVDVPALGKRVERGQPVEVADQAVAAALLAQADWAEAGAQAAEQKETAPAPPETRG